MICDGKAQDTSALLCLINDLLTDPPALASWDDPRAAVSRG